MHKETFTATIMKVRHEDKDGRFAIVEVSGGKVVKGAMMSPRIGHKYTFTATLTEERNRGEQWIIEKCSTIWPKDRSSAVSYLAAIPHVSRMAAEKIVATLGHDISDIARSPSRLKTVAGINSLQAEGVGNWLQGQLDFEELDGMLYAAGFQSWEIASIRDMYGGVAKSYIEHSPYQVLYEVTGLRFQPVDKLARKLGVPLAAPARIEAAVVCALRDAGDKGGHTWMYQWQVAYNVNKLTGNKVSEKTLNTGIVRAKENRRVIEWSSRFFYAENYFAERNVARNIITIRGRGDRFNDDFVEEWMKQDTTIKYAPEQIAAVMRAVKHPFSVITGGAGTGKSTVIRKVIHAIQHVHPAAKIVLAAPTGKAAQRMKEYTGIDAQTIHRTLNYGPFGKNGQFVFGYNDGNPLEGDLFIFDEMSMVTTELGDAALKAVPDGAKVVFVGDVQQLSAIGAGDVLNDIIRSQEVPITRLSKVQRQGEGSQIITVADAVAHGITPEFGNDCLLYETKNDEQIMSVVQDRVIELLKMGYSLEDIQIITPRKSGLLSVDSMNPLLQQISNPLGEVLTEFSGKSYRVGDKVIQTVNDYNRGVFNGDIGYIRGIQNDNILVDFGGGTDEPRAVEYRKGYLGSLWHAFAATVHRYQGSQAKAVIVVMADAHSAMTNRNLFYTAITRAEKLCWVVGTKNAVENGVAQVQKERQTYLDEFLHMDFNY